LMQLTQLGIAVLKPTATGKLGKAIRQDRVMKALRNNWLTLRYCNFWSNPSN
jgi:hypothetical protein